MDKRKPLGGTKDGAFMSQLQELEQSNINALEMLFASGASETYKKGETILQAHEPPKGVCFIKSGTIKSVSLTNEGLENTHLMYEKNSIIPLSWALSDKLPKVFYEALSDARVYCLPKRTFIEFLDQHPKVSRFLLKSATEYVAEYDNHIKNIGYRSAYQKLVHMVLVLSNHYGSDGPEGGCAVRISLTHQDMADLIHIARETASREIAKLQKKGLIKHSRSEITIYNIDKLRDEL